MIAPREEYRAKWTWLWTGLAIVAVAALSGCGKSESTAPQQSAPAASPATTQTNPDPVDLSQFQKAFSTARAGLKMTADEVVTAIRSRHFQDAVTQLQRMSGFKTLTPEQQQAVQDLISKVRALR